MSCPPTVRVALVSRADNVAFIREVLAGLGEAVDLDGALDDVKTAVSEACNNVVMHAYDGREGPLEVEMLLLPGALEVIVRDHGVGIGSQAGAEAAAADQMTSFGPGHGLGLAVISTLADELELRPREPAGLEVVMRFALAPPGHGSSRPEATSQPQGFDWPTAPDGEVQLSIAPASLSAAVLSRVVCATAARAGFSIDRLSDAQLVADALAAHLEPALSGPVVTLALKGEQRRLELALGPLRPGGSRSAVASSAVGELGPVIERLTDELGVRESDASELLTLVMLDDTRA
jgi:anti-sigma regulatory factor (Ser/Thr protein kinase)